jgi:hypothetical protein
MVEEHEPPTLVRCPKCCADPRADPDEECPLCKGVGKVNPSTAAVWRTQHQDE